ncbi:hypothetical protein OUZ56_031666 [Daphnia magna]|uniref:Uncharacterized protein n=1 Tax=Daphnia magna TaxID=35525 RepID=A0ABQ9ZV78_9CRUS|nr:hypothetical protein OUZ56_031666 [Daphnia magna]
MDESMNVVDKEERSRADMFLLETPANYIEATGRNVWIVCWTDERVQETTPRFPRCEKSLWGSTN